MASSAVDSFVLDDINDTKSIAIRSNGEVKIYPNILTSTVAYDIIGASGTESIVITPKRQVRKLVFENSGTDSITVTVSPYNGKMAE